MKKENNTSRTKLILTKGIDLINKIDSEPETKFLWKGIPEGSKGLLTGVAKTGKTTFAENLALSLAVGKKEFFGFPLDGIPRKVLFINLEEGYKIRTRRNKKQVRIFTEPEHQLYNENYISTPENFPEFIHTDENWNDMRNYIIESQADIIFIDSLSHLFSGKIEESTAVVQFIKKFRHYLCSLGKTLIVVHHNVKGNDKPIEQDSIAGSRLIMQEFEYAIGFSNIPTEIGGKYICELANKHIEVDNNNAILYEITEDNWFEEVGMDNKYNLYKENYKPDFRKDEENLKLVFDYIQSQYSLGNTTISTKDLESKFLENKIMSRDTLFKKLNLLRIKGKLIRLGKGIYQLKVLENESK